jgi:hypothetical protein
LERISLEYSGRRAELSPHPSDTLEHRAAGVFGCSGHEDLKLTHQELDFINGKDAEGKQITPASLRMDRADNGRLLMPRLRLIDGPPLVPYGQSYELHTRYSLFFKDCRIQNDFELEVDRPTEFPSIALARIARDVLDGDQVRAIYAFCGEDIAFMDKLTLISDSDATLLKGFRAQNPLQQPKSSEENCLTLRAAAEKLEQFDDRSWMQDEDTVPTRTALRGEPPSPYVLQGEWRNPSMILRAS